ncbi:NUDIX domain-containing protein [Methylomonas paludis]|uniref:NUDIX domain-containing protein n=1 Tax=Methylomonas paludis TaxID=1173101 RepID=A0A975R974_9GAMM|nr:NUDIX domain-containing protein [Methylomonas paludis]QWF69934.1 NUDIX domain-containing protein [Methylomonas paludis]
MPNELLPVVNEQDELIELRCRQEVHQLQLRHRAVHIFMFNEQGRLFLQKRSMFKDLNPGLWDTSAAGHVDGTESYDTCAHRELWEELGITALLYKLFKLDACPELGMEFIQVYRCMYNGPLKLEPAEIDEGAWYSLKDINTIVDKNDPQFTDTFKIIWRNFRLIGSM